MSDSEETFRDPARVALIRSISEKFNNVVKTRQEFTFRTAWTCLWLADLERLRELDGYSAFSLLGQLESVENSKMV